MFGGPVRADRISICPLDRVLTYKNLIYLLNLQICCIKAFSPSGFVALMFSRWIVMLLTVFRYVEYRFVLVEKNKIRNEYF